MLGSGFVNTRTHPAKQPFIKEMNSVSPFLSVSVSHTHALTHAGMLLFEQPAIFSSKLTEPAQTTGFGSTCRTKPHNIKLPPPCFTVWYGVIWMETLTLFPPHVAFIILTLLNSYIYLTREPSSKKLCRCPGDHLQTFSNITSSSWGSALGDSFLLLPVQFSDSVAL